MIHFDIKNLEKELQDLESQTVEENFWLDTKKSNKVLERIKKIKEKCITYRKIDNELINLKELSELVLVEYDEDIAKEVMTNTKNMSRKVEKLELDTLLSEKYDSNNAIVTIHPGAGGTESQDWVDMLYRMYVRWATKNNYKLNELDYLVGEVAGIKSVTFEVIGNNAWCT